jgi:hypothetical protein
MGSEERKSVRNLHCCRVCSVIEDEQEATLLRNESNRIWDIMTTHVKAEQLLNSDNLLTITGFEQHKSPFLRCI